MGPEIDRNQKGPQERKGAHLNEAFRAHGGSLSCGCFPNPEGKLQPGSNFYPDLVQLIKASSDRTSRNYSSRQRSARDRLRDVEAQTQELWTTSTPEIEQIREYLECFGDFWFLGILKARCRVRWMVPSDSICLNTIGLSKPASQCREHRQIHTVDILLRRESFNSQRRQGILGTLIHELCHALLKIYGCKCHISLADFLYFYGFEGHGKAWADLFLWVRASARIAFELDIDLHSHYNYSLELEAASLERLVHSRSGNHHQGLSIRYQPGTVLTVPANAELEELWREWMLRVG